MSLKALSKCVCGFVVPSMHVYLCLCACPDRQMTRVSHSVVAMGCLPLSLYLYLLSLPLSLSSLSPSPSLQCVSVWMNHSYNICESVRLSNPEGSRAMG